MFCNVQLVQSGKINTGGKITTFKVGHPVFDGDIRWCMFP